MPQNSFPRWWIAALVVAVLALMAGGIGFYQAQKQQLRQEAEANLQAITQLKVEQIAAWRAELLANAADRMKNSFTGEALIRWLAAPHSGETAQILTRFRSLQKNHHYMDVCLVDAEGQARLSASGRLDPLSPETAGALAAAWRDRQPTLTDLHAGPGDLPPHLDAIAPLYDDSGNPVGAVILQNDARQFLYPLVESWPIPSRTAEIVLVRRDGDAVLYLSPLRHESETALELRIPLSQANVPAVMAVLGRTGVVQGQDYRGVEVLSALQPIPNSPWFMQAKVDTAEALAAWRAYSVLIVALMVGLVVCVAAAAGLIWQRNEKAHYLALLQAQAARHESEERYRIILLSVGDGVIVTNTGGQVELLNPLAETLTGWRQAEAQGRPLEEVFYIVNEETHREVENPVSKTLRTGVVMGLANHTLLIARDGKERHIANSAAPIRRDNGDITGVALVFRDQTAERVAQKALQDSEELYRQTISSISDAVFLTGDCHNFVFICSNISLAFGWSEAEVMAMGHLRALIGDGPPIPDEVDDELRNMEWNIVDKAGNAHVLLVNIKRVNINKATRLYTCRDITERKQIEDVQMFLLQCGLPASGEDFFKALARYLFETLRVDYVCIDRLEGDCLSAQTLAIYYDGHFEDNVTYTLKDTPCGEVVGRRICSFPQGVRHLFPQDEVLQEMEAESYVGTTLWSSAGQPIGLIALIGRQPLKNLPLTESILNMVALRAAGELERRQAENALREKTEELDKFFSCALDLLCIADVESYFRRLNIEWENTLGYPLEDLLGRRFLDFIHPDDMEATLKAVAQLDAQKEVTNFVNRYRCRDGSYRWLEWRSFPAGKLVYATARDITERKQIEEQHMASLREKEIMLQEIHHRVKNNLQIISSLLDMQADSLADPRLLRVLQDSQGRVRSMALVHEKLYQSKNLAQIDFAGYLQEVVDYLSAAYNGPIVKVQAEQLYVGLDTAIPCGLIVNELVSNALKHAFPERPEQAEKSVAPDIWVGFAAEGNDYILTVGDNGRGLPPDFDIEHSSSLGLRLVYLLTQQLQGALDISRGQNDGARFKLRFSERRPAKGKK